MLDLIEAEPQGLNEARHLVESVSDEFLIDIDELNLLASILRQAQFQDCLVFEKHL
jgi:hypothetical protein